MRMTVPRTLFFLTSSSLSLLVGACQDDAAFDDKAAAHQAALNAEAILHQAGQSLGFTAASDGTLQRATGATGASARTVISPMMVGDMPPAMMRAVIGPTMTNAMTGTVMPSVLSPEEKLDQAGTEIRRLMQERLFVESNFESKAGDTAVYLLHADPTCRRLTTDSDPQGFVPPIATSCQEDLDKVEIRIAMKPDGDGARFSILIGPARLELLTVAIHSDELALEVGLPSAKAATDYINDRLGNSAPAGRYDRLAGRLRFSVKKVGAAKVTLSMSILEALDIAQNGGSEVSSAAADPFVALTGDAINKTAELRLGMGATDVLGTWDPHATGVSNRDLHESWAGIYGTFFIDDGAKKITWTDAGYGQTKLAVRGASIFDLNLNPDAMRRLSGKLLVKTDDTVRVELTPEFDLRLAFDYDAIAAELSSPPDPAIAHESYAVALTNPSGAAIFESVKSTATFTGGLRVVAGSLNLGAASVPSETVTVPAGKCLSTQSTAPANSNPFLGRLLVGDCP